MLSQEERNGLETALLEHLRIFDEAKTKAAESTIDQIRGMIAAKLARPLKNTFTNGMSKSQDLSKEFQTKDIAPNTLKAICRREGVFRKTFYNMNQDFLDPLVQPLRIPWRDVFQTILPALYVSFLKILIAALILLSCSIVSSLTKTFGPTYKLAKL